MGKQMRAISIPSYSMGEEISNAVSHGFGAILSAAALVLMLVRARGALAVTAAALFGSVMILLYTMSCLYHALPPSLSGKRVLRVLDHCNVFLLVFGTYIPASLLGVCGVRGWVLFSVVAFLTLLGIVFTVINMEPESMPGGGIKGNASKLSGFKVTNNGERVPFVSVTFNPKDGAEGKTTDRKPLS